MILIRTPNYAPSSFASTLLSTTSTLFPYLCPHKTSFTLSCILGIRLKLLIRDMNVQQFYYTYTSHSLYRVVWPHIDACAGPGRISSHWKIRRISNCVCAGCLKHPPSGGLAKCQWHQCLHIKLEPSHSSPHWNNRLSWELRTSTDKHTEHPFQTFSMHTSCYYFPTISKNSAHVSCLKTGEREGGQRGSATFW